LIEVFFLSRHLVYRIMLYDHISNIPIQKENIAHVTCRIILIL